MNLKLVEHITMSEESGVARVAGRRLTVHFLVSLVYEQGLSVEEVARDYDLTLGQVYAVLSFYHDNQAQIDVLRQQEKAAQDTIEQLPAIAQGELWRVMTVQEIARAFQIDESTVREAVAKGWVHGRKAGGTWLISQRDAIARWKS